MKRYPTDDALVDTYTHREARSKSKGVERHLDALRHVAHACYDDGYDAGRADALQGAVERWVVVNIKSGKVFSITYETEEAAAMAADVKSGFFKGSHVARKVRLVVEQ